MFLSLPFGVCGTSEHVTHVVKKCKAIDNIIDFQSFGKQYTMLPTTSTDEPAFLVFFIYYMLPSAHEQHAKLPTTSVFDKHAFLFLSLCYNLYNLYRSTPLKIIKYIYFNTQAIHLIIHSNMHPTKDHYSISLFMQYKLFM